VHAFLAREEPPARDTQDGAKPVPSTTMPADDTATP
jgi:hypothetical protein